MKLKLRFNRMPDTEKNRKLVNEELAALETSGSPIREAHATLEHPEQDERITMKVKLNLAGSPVVAEAKDYTIRAVLHKAMAMLRKKLANRGGAKGITPYDRRRHSLPGAARA